MEEFGSNNSFLGVFLVSVYVLGVSKPSILVAFLQDIFPL